MFVIKRNQVIITALVIMVAVAGYLNYVDNSSVGNEIMLNDDGEVAALVPNDSLPANSNMDSEVGIALTPDENDEKKLMLVNLGPLSSLIIQLILHISFR